MRNTHFLHRWPGRLPFAVTLAVISLILAGQSFFVLAAEDRGYLGSRACADCHRQQYQLWQGSHHDWAMKAANAETVLGDFENVRFDHYGEKSRFFKRDGRYFVETDNAEGKQQVFQISYTFGVYPLQQYLIAFPNGRYQALGLAWDSRPKAEGGQRWFHLYPDEAVPHTDQLHWTGSYFNWNSRCAECHSTNLQKNYDPTADRYQTTWSEINVGCEACHGPGADHVSGARQGKLAALPHSGFHWDLSAVGLWLQEKGQATARLQQGPGSAAYPWHTQLDACGGCHSRRSVIGEEHRGWGYHDTYQLSLPQPPLYHADGQILDEDYVLGSFVQSKMFHQGVVCSNCHDPHSLALKAPGNGVCAQCHNPTVFDRPSHHHHPQGSEGALCANCHMPETTYMVVDPRRDHSIRIPRPDLSVSHQTPNACNGCHRQQPAQWAADAVANWLAQGPVDKASSAPSPHFSEQLITAQLPGGAGVELMQLAMNGLQPAVARAAALAQLPASPQSLLAVQTNLTAADPLVRRAAVDALAMVPPEQRLTDLWPLVKDPVKTVRMGVAAQLAAVDDQRLSQQQRQALQPLFEEYQQALQLHADMPAAQVNRGLFFTARRQYSEAEQAYRHALSLDRLYVGAYLNLADLYRQLNRDGEGEKLLRQALASLPEGAEAGSPQASQRATVLHALGLLLVRQKRYEEALSALERATGLAPEQMRYGYIYAVALNSQGQAAAALKRLQDLDRRFPNQAEILMALIDILTRQERWREALDYAEQMQTLQPDNPQLQQWIGYLRRQLGR